MLPAAELEEVWKGISSTDTSHSCRFQEGCRPVTPSPSHDLGLLLCTQCPTSSQFLMSLGFCCCCCLNRFQLLPSQPSCPAGPPLPCHLTALSDEPFTYSLKPSASSGSNANKAFGLAVLLRDPTLLSLLLAPASLLHPPGHKPLCLLTPETCTKHMHSLLGGFMDSPQSQDPVIPPHWVKHPGQRLLRPPTRIPVWTPPPPSRPQSAGTSTVK